MSKPAWVGDTVIEELPFARRFCRSFPTPQAPQWADSQGSSCRARLSFMPTDKDGKSDGGNGRKPPPTEPVAKKTRKDTRRKTNARKKSNKGRKKR
jgi:hypothetical protein